MCSGYSRGVCVLPTMHYIRINTGLVFSVLSLAIQYVICDTAMIVMFPLIRLD